MKLIEDLKKYLKTISPYLIIIVVMFFWIMWLTECRGKKEPEPKVKIEYKTETIIVRDTVWRTRTEYVPKWNDRIVYIDYPVWQPIDTLEILKDYFTVYYYADTLINDTTAFITIYDSIARNNIKSRTWKYQNRRPTQIITNTTTITDCKKWNIGLGGFFGGNLQRFDAGVGIIVTTNNRASYQAEYCFTDKSIRIGYYYNLRK